MVVKSWSSIFGEDLNESAIRNHFKPESAYLVSFLSYPAGARFGAATRACFLLVIRGACKLTTNESVLISAGEFVECGDTRYEFETIGDGAVKLAMVWSLVSQ